MSASPPLPSRSPRPDSISFHRSRSHPMGASCPPAVIRAKRALGRRLVENIPENLAFPVDIPQERVFLWLIHMSDSNKDKLELLQGTLDLLVLQTLATMGAMHGYGIARRIEQVADNELLLNQGTIYAALVRLQQGKWIEAEWGASDNNRKAKYYQITTRGRRQLEKETENWVRVSHVVQRILSASKNSAP